MERVVDESLLSEAHCRDLKSVGRPVDEGQWGRIRDIELELDALERLYETFGNSANAERHIIVESRKDLSDARACIVARPKLRRFFQENHTLFWHLIHRIEADMLLLVPLAELSSRAAEVLADFERNVSNLREQAIWLGPDGKGRVPAAIEKINATLQDAPTPDARMPSSLCPVERDTIRYALNMINESSETAFRQLNFATLMRSFSALALVATGVAAWLVHHYFWTQKWSLAIVVMLLGATGAYVATILSEEPRLKTRGPARRHIFYSIFVRPTIGVVAASFVYLLGLSPSLVDIGTPLSTPGASGGERSAQPAPDNDRIRGATGTPASSATKEVEGTRAIGTGTSAPSPTGTSSSATSADMKKQSEPFLRVRLPPTDPSDGSNFAVWAVLALVFGYGAQRILGGMMDNILNRLYNQADKKIKNPDPSETSGPTLRS